MKIPALTRYARNKRWQFFKTHSLPRERVLDVGCGGGWFTRKVNSEGGNAIGCDQNGETGLRADAGNLPFGDNSFDVVVLWEVIEHIPPSAYDELERVCRPGGRIMISTPRPWSNWLVELCEKLGLVNPLGTPHVNLVRVEDLPWELMARDTILAIDQLAVFRVNK